MIAPIVMVIVGNVMSLSLSFTECRGVDREGPMARVSISRAV